jgi:hypothetical protein
MTKTVTLSARVSHEDAEFISQLKISGAHTPSDKVRAIIHEKRTRAESQQSYRGCIGLAQDLVTPVTSRMRELEAEHRIHSELVSRVMDWLPDTMAFVLATDTLGNGGPDQLTGMEAGVADRVFRLMESVLQMAVTPRCACYDGSALHARITPVLTLAQIIKNNTQPAQEQQP